MDTSRVGEASHTKCAVVSVDTTLYIVRFVRCAKVVGGVCTIDVVDSERIHVNPQCDVAGNVMVKGKANGY